MIIIFCKVMNGFDRSIYNRHMHKHSIHYQSVHMIIIALGIIIYIIINLFLLYVLFHVTNYGPCV